MLERDGDLYANTAATDLYLDRAKPEYVGGMVVGMAADTSHWDSLTTALRTGRPQIGGDQDYLDQYHDPALLAEFMHSMTGLSMGAARAIAEKFPWQATERSSTSTRPKDACRSSSRSATRS
jgi:hypothetical protein